MLAIKTKDGWINWWLGCAIPPTDRVQMFQADGDELCLFLDAMESTRRSIRGVTYSKEEGFESRAHKAVEELESLNQVNPSRDVSLDRLTDQRIPEQSIDAAEDGPEVRILRGDQ